MFVFRTDAAFFQDQITDFNAYGAGADSIDLSSFGFAGDLFDSRQWADSHVQHLSGGDLQITLSGSQSILIANHANQGDSFFDNTLDLLIF